MGYTIYVLYTPYYDLMNDYYLNGTNPSSAAIVQASSADPASTRYKLSIPYNLQQCASSLSAYIEASDTDGITRALQTFLQQAMKASARLTQ
ncbi:MAG: hypothetical protein ACJ8AW_01585 [Rhodopila sp.]